MSILTSRHKNFPIPNNLKLAGIIAGLCAACLIFALIYLSALPNFSQVVNCLSEVRVTPSWPQIGIFSGP
jgi:hypothetical protein